ncbi:hypothetical protein [Oceaniferula spumae]|uniref:hypothetical protein n=1 Tax=Oceaniferula spumae TaxID=2979115 RepID=UPI003F4EFCB2
MMTLLLLISLAMLSLGQLHSRSANNDQAQIQAEANARVALMIAIGELQKYAGSDQRVTARADITDEDWHKTESDLENPLYTYVWDVSGSEMDLSPSSYAINVETNRHRPGMIPGHDFKRKPAVLVSGNARFDLTDGSRLLDKTSYPEGYVTADKAADQKWVNIVSSEFMLQHDDAPAARPVNVPLVGIQGGEYAWWVADESVKNRVDLGNQHEQDSVAARMMAQRAPINPFRDGADGLEMDTREASQLVTVGATGLAHDMQRDQTGGAFSYSPDLTVSSENLLTDVRSGGLRQDLTYAIFNDQNAPDMPEELMDVSPQMDALSAQAWGPPASGDSNNGGLSPMPVYFRNYANRFNGNANQEVSIGTDGIAPVMSQVQSGIHAAYRIVEPGKFQVYYSVFPAVTLWNPYNVPIRLDKRIEIHQERRSGTANWWLYLFRANYSLQSEPGATIFSEGKVYNNSGGARGGWKFTMVITADVDAVLKPGETMVFSPEANTFDHSPAAQYTSPPPGESWTGSTRATSFTVELAKGWRPGKGHAFSLDGRTHDMATLAPTDTRYPKISFGLGGVGNDNNLWYARYDDSGSMKYMSYWSRLSSRVGSNSPFFDAPTTDDSHQDTRGDFPGLLYKYALRMGEDYLPLQADRIHPDQKSLLFPYMAHYNPKAVFHAGIGDTYSHSKNSGLTKFYASEGTEISPSLMGGLYDYQNARSIYTVPTVDAEERQTFIGNGYLGPAKKMVISETGSGPEPGYPNGESGSITSLTQLNHSGFTAGANTTRGTLRYMWLGTSNYPAYPIGNSIADFRLNVLHDDVSSPSLVHVGSMGKRDYQNWRVTSNHYDISYLLNDRYYDRYFFSTVPQTGKYMPEEPLINSRMRPQTEDVEMLRQITSAKRLRLRGGFNINSTSVAAWEMLLSSSLGIDRDQLGGSPESTVSFSPRMDAFGSVDVTSISETDAASGDKHIRLTSDQVRTLAEEIVHQIKRRGPFPSVASFVNRTDQLESLLREDTSGGGAEYEDVRFAGAIQAAIDAAGLLGTLEGDKVIDPSEYVDDIRFYPGAKSVRKSANSHLPGALKQSDILRQIDPFITARGDSFTIRAMGVSKDAAGKVLARAVCEAVVQREVEYLDPTEASDKAPYEVAVNDDGTREFTPVLNPVNQRFGRRFIIQSFRWLPKSEVAHMTSS